MCLEVAFVMSIFAFGNIFFGHFEERTPKWRRALKVVVFVALTMALSAAFGRAWAMTFLGCAAIVPFAVIHLWWLRRHGVNGWTGEPKDTYYRLRGWEQ